MILEGLVTTLDSDRELHLAPMGPECDPGQQELTLKPFRTASTATNLLSRGCGVFHVVDNVEWIARGAIGCWDEMPETKPAQHVDGRVLVDCCRWFEFEVMDIDQSSDRLRISTRITNTQTHRPFWGFNRAKHAVLETAIVATCLHLLERSTILEQLEHSRVLVEKTGGEQEHLAWSLLQTYVENWYASSS